ncbi:MoaD/ThiS family protein [Aquimarina sp. 2201CG14-23]|uniref:MoaD/ThiS family protein n=1 Tax=Aquimarina mycalae TaxID=3040073 RepID=UPI002477DB3B|nr:MoaD/ThiS family protein [Aquimarina sp. 2201CG14-23]MDH7444167.1 MoaD/ThiS family protein [Aquimarina sp. 2201CG14-23]
MELKVMYFGMIAEATNCREEIISVGNRCSIYQLENLLKDKYQNLQPISFKIAVDKEILQNDILLTPNTEIALLPSFAGG